MKKNIATIGVALLLICTFCTSAFAADLTNSTGSAATDFSEKTVVGNDSTQSKTSKYEDAVVDSTATAESKTATVEVYATKASTYSVKIPKVVILDGATGNGAYSIGVKGDISGAQTITVAPEDADAETPGVNFSLSEQAVLNPKANITATVDQSKTSFTQNEITAADWTTVEATVAAPEITAGSWMGTFTFNISIA